MFHALLDSQRLFVVLCFLPILAELVKAMVANLRLLRLFARARPPHVCLRLSVLQQFYMSLLCRFSKLVQSSREEVRQFEKDWMQSEEGEKWMEKATKVSSLNPDLISTVPATPALPKQTRTTQSPKYSSVSPARDVQPADKELEQ